MLGYGLTVRAYAAIEAYASFSLAAGSHSTVTYASAPPATGQNRQTKRQDYRSATLAIGDRQKRSSGMNLKTPHSAARDPTWVSVSLTRERTGQAIRNDLT